ncbi:uncharacterized protein LOC110466003 [Mizuhopecten yessoensis]|uniref:Nucleolus and neural progenitor protein-like N-terminal domain-containing protein n=1 Tax=Mizuhopecten yessoensis TaxID=6573 RepID=A0A210PQ98_MIZYE|nr:uncharacterized protein LOC110466003 [Mizuhopecten yessoensis]OWF38679.1 hypothetical protein KP79_PYT10807 [Mizuhopecten yessoensis]
MWNQKVVVPPIVCNMKTNITGKNKGHFKNMKTTMANLTHLLSDVSVWNSEEHILSKMVYKNHSQRRREKTLQGLKRIKSCVERFCALEEIKYLEDITSSLEAADLNDDNAYLPSRQMLEFVLVRLMGVAALLTQTSAYCVYTFLTVQQDLETGIFIPQSMVFLSVASRIWALSKSTCIYMITWYNTLQKCLEHLEPTQVVWLEDPGILPVCLGKWLEGFDRKSLPTERATVVMTELAKPCADQRLDAGSPTQQTTTHGFVKNDKEAESIVTTDQEETSDDSEDMDEDLGCSISRNDFSSKKKTRNKKNKKCIVQDQKTKISANQAIEELELVDSLEDLLQLVIRTECPNVGGLYRKKCVERLHKLMVVSSTKKKHQNQAKFVKKGKISVRKFLLLNVRTESSVVQEDSMSHKQLRVVELEELQTQQHVKNLLVNFRRNNSIFLQGRCVRIDDQKCARRIRITLKQCLSKIKRNSDATEQLVNKAVKVVTSVVEQIEGDTPDISEDQANESIWESEQAENTPCKINSVKKGKKDRLEDALKITAKARKEKKKKMEMSDAKTVDIETPRSITPLKRKTSTEEIGDIIPEKKKTKTSGTKKQKLKLSIPVEKSPRKNKKTGKGKAKTK